MSNIGNGHGAKLGTEKISVFAVIILVATTIAKIQCPGYSLTGRWIGRYYGNGER